MIFSSNLFQNSLKEFIRESSLRIFKEFAKARRSFNRQSFKPRKLDSKLTVDF